MPASTLNYSIHRGRMNFNETSTLPSMTERGFHAFILILISILVIVGNALVVSVVKLDRHLHKPTFYFLVNLAAADLMIGALYAPFYTVAVIEQRWVFATAWCGGHAFLISASVNASILTLSLVSFDRFKDITNPLRYHTKVTPRLTLFLIIFCWVHSIFWAAGPLFNWGAVMYDTNTNTCRPNWAAEGVPAKIYALGLAVFGFAIPVLIMVFCYARIFMVAGKHIKRIQKDNQSSVASQHDGREAVCRQTVELKAHKTILLIIGAFIVCWSLYTITTSWKLLTGQSSAPYRVSNAGLTLALLNSGVNPAIYSMRDRRFRKGFVKAFLILLRKLEQDGPRDRGSSRIRMMLEQHRGVSTTNEL